MKTQNITSIHAVDKEMVLQLIAASIEACNAFDRENPRVCQIDKITPPAGSEYVDY
ncbi:hypothetical protein ACFPK9_00865 [Rubritalea spongiae]|uniref:Uncharacterized protein n=1 Tax=Rubritalea spongiae TaxID=430797 RepID=A0ABW5E5W1_9BACT